MDTDAIKAALQGGDFAPLQAEATVVDGCWLWPHLNHRGYPNLGREWSLHRKVLEAKLGGALGADQAHHVCGVRACVNPAHLEATSRRANIGEMQARAYYLKVEARLRELHPDDPVLNRLGPM